MVSLSPVERDAHLDWGEFTGRRSVVDRFRHDRLALAASVLLLALIMICALAPVTAPYSPYKIDPANLFAPPGSPGHLLGTDNEGRDMLSRLIWGGRVSLVTGIVPVIIGLVVGGSIGLLAGFKGGATRTTIMRAMDVFLAFPAVLLAIAIAMTLGRDAQPHHRTIRRAHPGGGTSDRRRQHLSVQPGVHGGGQGLGRVQPDDYLRTALEKCGVASSRLLF